MTLQELRVGNFIEIEGVEKRLGSDDFIRILKGYIDINDIDPVILRDKNIIDFGFVLYDKKNNTLSLDNTGDWDLFRFNGYIMVLKQDGEHFLGNKEANYDESTSVNSISNRICFVHQLQNIMQSLYGVML